MPSGKKKKSKLQTLAYICEWLEHVKYHAWIMSQDFGSVYVRTNELSVFNTSFYIVHKLIVIMVSKLERFFRTSHKYMNPRQLM